MEDKWVNLRNQMVKEQLMNRDITDRDVLKAFLSVPRHLFVKKRFSLEAYNDYPLEIGNGQTISQPYIVALMSQALSLKKTDHILEIGTGSGYQTAILAHIVDQVYTIERIPILSITAKKTLTKLGYKNISYACGDGTRAWSEERFFDAILLGAACAKIPSLLLHQLKVDGKMVLPLGDNYSQELTLIHKKEQGLTKTVLCDCRFVPLITT